MRRRKGAKVAVVTLPDDAEDEEVEEDKEKDAAQQESDADTAQVLDELPVRTTVTLWRRDSRTGREAYLDKIDAKAFTKEFVKEQYGGGDYRAEVRGPVGKGRLRSYKGSESFTIDRSIPPKYPRDPVPADPEVRAAQGALVPVSGAAMLDTAVAGVVMQMVQQMQTMQQMQMTMMADHSKALAAQLEALSNRSREPERDPIETFRAMAEIMKPAQALGSPLAAVKDFLEVKQLMEPSEGDPSALGVVKELGPRALDTINRVLDRREQRPMVYNPDGTAVVPAPAASGGLPTVLQLLKPWESRLVKWATQGRPVEWTAETIYFEVPVGYHPALAAALAPEDTVEKIVQGLPSLSPFAEWVSGVRLALLDMLRGDTADAADVATGG